MKWIFLDSDPAGLACHKVGNSEASNLRIWLAGQIATSVRLVIPEIVDYEVHRSLIENEAWDGVRRLDKLYTTGTVELLLLDRKAMLKAAELWAEARRKHQPTADLRSLDGDVILAAQVMTRCSDADDWMILTENVSHIARYVHDHARSRREVVADYLRSPESFLKD